MLITYHGHSEFLLETAAGLRILTDPYLPEMVGYAPRRVTADLVTVSHRHEDHAYLDKVDGSPLVLRTEGAHAAPGVTVRMLPAFHDDARGAKRGVTLLTRVETEGLVVAHLGDLGCMPSDEQLAFLTGVSVMLLPVGGFYTVGPALAADIVRQTQPRVVIPMHYRNEKGGFEAIGTVQPFLDAMRPAVPRRMPLMRVTSDDLSQQPALAVLDIG